MTDFSLKRPQEKSIKRLPVLLAKAGVVGECARAKVIPVVFTKSFVVFCFFFPQLVFGVLY